MGEYTRVVFGALEQGQADFTQAYEALRTEVSRLDTRLRSALPGLDGPAQQGYLTARAQMDAAMASMAQVLSRLGAVIGTASSSYQSAEAANTALWS
jgi:WXG100 family type VII secretion target